MEFLAFSEDMRERKETQLYWGPSAGLLLGTVGLEFVGLSLCYYEPLPYHVQATKDAKRWRCNFVFAMSDLLTLSRF